MMNENIGTGNDGAVNWHSQVASEFDSKYSTSSEFIERLTIWEKLIEKHSFQTAKVLDAGCGSGIFSLIAAKHVQSVIGFDASVDMVALAKQKKSKLNCDNVSFHKANLEDIGFLKKQKFDLIMCSSVLEYVEDYPSVFDSFIEHLALGGKIIFSMPNGKSLYRKMERFLFATMGKPKYIEHVRNMPSLKNVREQLSNRSVEVLESHYYAGRFGMSSIAKAFGLQSRAENLFVVVCTRK